MYRIVIILILFLSVEKYKAQDTLNTLLVEKVSYQLYQEKKWDELIVFSKKAIKQDFDYYYLRLRVGIAYYEQKKYLLATTHFQKAIVFNSSDDLIKEYLYYCYIYSGRYVDAKILSNEFGDDLVKKIGINNSSSLDIIEISAGGKFPNSPQFENTHPEKLYNIRNLDSADVNSTDTARYSNAKYFQLAFGHYVKNRFYLFHAFSNFVQETDHFSHGFKTFDLHDPPILPPGETNHFTASTTKNSYDVTKQIQYYIGATIPFKNNWTVSPAIHFINSSIQSKTENTVFSKSVMHPAMQPPEIVEVPFNPTLQTTTVKTNSIYMVESFSVSKRISNLSISLGNTFSNFDKTKRIQTSLSINYAPLGNNRVVLSGEVHHVYTIDSAESRVALAPTITLFPTDRIMLTLGYMVDFNDKQKDVHSNNVIEGNGLLINNSTDKTHSRFSAVGNFIIGKHLDLFAVYTYENNFATLPLPPDHPNAPPLGFNYYYNNFFVGIRIKNFKKFTNQNNN